MTDRKEEIEANLFALELLIPEKMLLNEIYKIKKPYIRNEFIKKLAKKFKVSEIVMTTRLLNLGILTSI